MTSIRTINHLQQVLDGEHAWRIKEIASLKSAARRPKDLSEETIVRAGVALAYAHWEGFVKAACCAYVDYVASTRMNSNQLTTPFAVMALGGRLKTLAESETGAAAAQAFEFIRDSLEKRVHFAGKDIISTEANLSSTVFRKIFLSIGISVGPYESRFNFIDETLLKNRHAVAHGSDLVLDKSGWASVADETLVLLRWVKDDIQNAASSGAFRRGIGSS